MKKLLFIALTLFAGAVFAQASVDSMPPVVIETFPIAGELKVPPGLLTLKVVFSKDMLEDSWSWVKVSNVDFPEIVGDVQFTDARTCVLQVKLEPNRTYAIWFNSEEHRGFRDLNGSSAVPYLLAFETGSK